MHAAAGARAFATSRGSPGRTMLGTNCDNFVRGLTSSRDRWGPKGRQRRRMDVDEQRTFTKMKKIMVAGLATLATLAGALERADA